MAFIFVILMAFIGGGVQGVIAQELTEAAAAPSTRYELTAISRNQARPNSSARNEAIWGARRQLLQKIYALKLSDRQTVQTLLKSNPQWEAALKQQVNQVPVRASRDFPDGSVQVYLVMEDALASLEAILEYEIPVALNKPTLILMTVPQTSTVAEASPSAPPAETGPEQEFYTRKHFSFFQNQVGHPLNPILVDYFRQVLPRFDYHLIGTKIDTDLPQFLTAVKAYQKGAAGQLAAKGEREDVKFGTQVVSWSEARQIAASAYVWQSDWRFAPITLSGPDRHEIRENKKGKFEDNLHASVYTQIIEKEEERENPETEEKEKIMVRYKLYWTIKDGTRLSGRFNLYKLAQDAPEKMDTFASGWHFSTSHHVTGADVEQAAELAREPVDLVEGTNKDYLLQLPRFVALTKLDPYKRYIDDAKHDLDTNGSWFGSISADLKKMDDFILKAQVDTLDRERDLALIGFGGKESAGSLGVRLRDWYKVIEYRQENGSTQKYEIGAGKVRGANKDHGLLQPILTGREFEMGDQIIEYKQDKGQADLNLSALWMFDATPAAMLSTRIETPLDTVKVSDLPVDRNPFPWENNLFYGIGFGYNPTQSAGGVFDLNIGWTGRLFMRQWIVGTSASLSFAGLFSPGDFVAKRDKAFKYFLIGPVLSAGLHYQLTPELMLGIDAGVRLYYGFGDLRAAGFVPALELGSFIAF